MPTLFSRLALLSAAVVALATVLFLAISGAPFNASSVFVVLGALALDLTVVVLVRAGVALLYEPAEAERRIATGRRRKELEREKQSLLKALKDLEFDHAMRKISTDDFTDFTARYRARAIQILKQLDASDLDYRALVEKDLAAQLRKPEEKAVKPVDVDSVAVPMPEHEQENVAVQEKAKSVGPALRWSCSSCATANDPDALFCKRCGKQPTAAVAS